MNCIAKILLIELADPEDVILQEILAFLSDKKQCRVLNPSQSVIVDEKDEHIMTFPGLEIRLKEQLVYRDGMPISLSHYEFSTLYYLARHPGWIFSKRQIYEAVWGQPAEHCNAAVTNVISQIRKKLNPENPKGGYIKTVVNSGYKFEPCNDNIEKNIRSNR